jgi:hypothetical protein
MERSFLAGVVAVPAVGNGRAPGGFPARRVAPLTVNTAALQVNGLR